METLDEAVRLASADFHSSVLDVLELQEVLRPLRIHTPRTLPELTWSLRGISSSANRWAPWVGCLSA